MYAMTLKEMDRLESNCSATSRVSALLVVRLSPAMAMPEHPNPCRHGVSNPCLIPLKHECMNHAICDTRTH